MTEAWIDTLAQDIKEKHREAAQDYGRAQHFAGIVAERGKGYFVVLVSCLQENVDVLRRRLQGDPTSADTTFQTIKPDEVKITRARFPWVDAHLTHRDDTIALDYAKGLGSAGDPQLGRKTNTFVFRVSPDDTLFAEEAFAPQPRPFPKPEDLARHITELLFGVDSPVAK
jgi:hypothetical protein